MCETLSGFFHLSDELFRNPLGTPLNLNVSKESPANRPKVLVVDDERLIVDTIVQILEGAGFEVSAAYEGLDVEIGKG